MPGIGVGSVRIEAYGCAMNQGESALAASILRSRGYDIAVEGSDIGTVIIFTCDVIEATENRMWKRIAYVHASGKRLIVAGCLASISGSEIIARYPGAQVIDTMGIAPLRTSIEGLFPVIGPIRGAEGPIERVHHIIPISTGCMGSCTYCITKNARGSILSNPPEQIVQELKRGIHSGRMEILLTSQDSAVYGSDTTGPDLPELLRTVTNEVEGEYMIRVGMMNPGNILPRLDRLLDSFSSERIFKFFHIPLQSGSDRILSMMERGYTVSEFHRIADEVRGRYPDATISTDMIVGFPGEDREDHKADMEAIERARPDILNVTRFSPRPGTGAERMKGRVLQRTVKERSREMVAGHSEILKNTLDARSKIGPGPILVTEIGKRGTVMGRDINYTPIVIKGGPDILGRWVDVERLRAGSTYIVARPIR